MSNEKETYLYRHFDKDNQLLYVGISIDPKRRYLQHCENKDWTGDIQNITIEAFQNRELALRAEKEAIIKEKPIYNIQHNRTVREEENNINFIEKPFCLDEQFELLKMVGWPKGYVRRNNKYMYHYLLFDSKILNEKNCLCISVDKLLSDDPGGWGLAIAYDEKARVQFPLDTSYELLLSPSNGVIKVMEQPEIKKERLETGRLVDLSELKYYGWNWNSKQKWKNVNEKTTR